MFVCVCGTGRGARKDENKEKKDLGVDDSKEAEEEEKGRNVME